MSKPAFPKVIRVGQTRATIYKTPSHGCDSFTVAWYEGSVRYRKSFADLVEAEVHANSKVDSLASGEAKILHLTGEERLAYVRGQEAVAEFGLALDSVAVEYRDAKRLLRGGSLLEAARYYAAHKLHDIPEMTVPEVVQEMLKAKRDEGLSQRYLRDLELRMAHFVADEKFQGQISGVTGPQIKEWLQNKNVGNRTKNNLRTGLHTLFMFAKAQKYVPKEWSEFDAVPAWKAKDEEIEIFTPAEMAMVLSAADKQMIPFLAIGGFAGLRSAEIERLDWSKVNLKTGYITVDASIAKTNSRRLVPISPNLNAWLVPLAKKQGPVVAVGTVSHALRRLVQLINAKLTSKADTASLPASHGGEGKKAFAWKHNALRHSFCSYRMAFVKSAAEVALEAGNTPKMIFRHYRELVTEDDAKAWFAIEPK